MIKYKSKNKCVVGDTISSIYTKKGEEVLVSTSDLPKVLQITWHVGSRGYVVGRLKDKIVSLHRYLLDFPSDEVDHKDRNKLNNTRENLRECTSLVNRQNKGTYHNNKCQSKGVSFIPRLNKWRARVYIQGKEIHLGMFNTKEEAIHQRKLAEQQHYEGSIQL